jgi:hypothetical protein
MGSSRESTVRHDSEKSISGASETAGWVYAIQLAPGAARFRELEMKTISKEPMDGWSRLWPVFAALCIHFGR